MMSHSASAAELAAGMAANYAGHDAAKGYAEQAEELKKDPVYAAGKACQKLRQVSFSDRRNSRFRTMVEAFVKKYPEGFYTTLAKALLPGE